MDELHPRLRLLLHRLSSHRPPPDLTPTSGRLFVTGSTPFTPTSLARVALTTGSAATFRASLDLCRIDRCLAHRSSLQHLLQLVLASYCFKSAQLLLH
jgi:hypothetical protein